MTSRDFINAEAGNTDRITLYREGLFWKAYERSAFAVCAQVRGFKATKKVLKALDGGTLVSIGFPTRHEASVLEGLQRLSEEENRLVLQTPRPIVSKEFEIWKESIPVRRPTGKEGGARRTAARAAAAERPANPSERIEDRCGAHVPAGAAAQRLPESDAIPGGPAPQAAGARFPNGGTPTPPAWRPNGGTPTPGGVAARPIGGSAPDEVLPPTHPAWRPSDEAAPHGDADFSLAEACRVAEAVRRFNQAEKTPMECMLFISELKKMLANC